MFAGLFALVGDVVVGRRARGSGAREKASAAPAIASRLCRCRDLGRLFSTVGKFSKFAECYTS
jgi:hypothetical protein